MDLQNLKQVCFVLENCDGIVIPGYLIDRVTMGEVVTNQYILDSLTKETKDYLYTDYMRLEILNDTSKFEYETNFRNTQTAFERLRACDTTRVEFQFKDDTKQEIIVPWHIRAEWYNYHQFITENKGYITVEFDINKLKRWPLIREILKNFYYDCKRRVFKVFWVFWRKKW
jgi:viroplasmin and RNaseH domain-containing protein